MTSDVAPTYPHLGRRALAQIELPNEERIRIIRAGTWMGLQHAKSALEKMVELVDYPRVTRMPNILLVGSSFSGKTSILEHFRDLYLPNLDAAEEVTTCPVIMVDAPPKPDLSDFYSRILDALMSPYKPTASAAEKYSQVKRLFKPMGVKVLIIDEIHHLIAGSLNRQREFRNALKSLGNETKVCMVASGTEDAYNAFNADAQMSSRFHPIHLPSWSVGEELGVLVATLEDRLPLKLPSDLKSVEMMTLVLARSEGTLGDICDLVKEAAVEAVRSGAECISPTLLASLDWVPPSRRKQYRRAA